MGRALCHCATEPIKKQCRVQCSFAWSYRPIADRRALCCVPVNDLVSEFTKEIWAIGVGIMTEHRTDIELLMICVVSWWHDKRHHRVKKRVSALLYPVTRRICFYLFASYCVYTGRLYLKKQQVRGQAHCPFRVVFPFPSKNLVSGAQKGWVSKKEYLFGYEDGWGQHDLNVEPFHVWSLFITYK